MLINDHFVEVNLFTKIEIQNSCQKLRIIIERLKKDVTFPDTQIYFHKSILNYTPFKNNIY